MKKLMVFVAAFVAVLAFQTTSASAAYSCKYRVQGGVVASLSGRDLSPYLCSSFEQGSFVRTSYAPGRTMCAWRMRAMDVVVAVKASQAQNGRVFCRMLAPKVGAEFVRIA